MNHQPEESKAPVVSPEDLRRYFLKTLGFALSKYQSRVTIQFLPQVIAAMVRKNDKRPARIVINAPDEVVKNLKGEQEMRDLYLILRIPREVVDRSDSGIVLPGEVGRR